MLSVLFSRPPFLLISEQDEEICKIQGAIAAGMVTNASFLQTYLKTWDKHREIWEIEKDGFIQRYQRLNPTVASFDADIARSLSFPQNHCVMLPKSGLFNWLYAQLPLLNFCQLLVSCLPLLDKPINPGVSDLSSHNNSNQAHLN